MISKKCCDPTLLPVLKIKTPKKPTGLGALLSELLRVSGALTASQIFWPIRDEKKTRRGAFRPAQGRTPPRERVQVEPDRMRRSERNPVPPKRPLDDEFEGPRRRAPREDDGGIRNVESLGTRRGRGSRGVRFSQEDHDAQVRERRAAQKRVKKKAKAKRARERKMLERARAQEEARAADVARNLGDEQARARQEMHARHLRSAQELPMAPGRRSSSTRGCATTDRAGLFGSTRARSTTRWRSLRRRRSSRLLRAAGGRDCCDPGQGVLQRRLAPSGRG